MGLFPFLVLMAFYGQACSITLENELEDYPEDKKFNIRNPCVLWGVKQTAFVGLLLTTLSSIFLVIVYFVFLKYSYIFIPVFILCYSYVIYNLYKTYLLCSEYELTKSDETMIRIKIMGRKLPLWLFWIGIPLILAPVINLLLGS